MPQYTYPDDFEGTFWTVVDGDYYVSTVGNDITGDGSPKNPFLTVAKAFDLALDGEKIIIGPDEYVSYKPVDVAPSGAHIPCRVATDGNFIVGSGGGGEAVIDGIQTNSGDRVLVWEQTDPIENGIYVVSSGVWERSGDFNSLSELVSGKMIPVLEGTKNGRKAFQHITTGNIIVDATPIVIERATATDWGEIGGTLTDQTDLNNALGLKADQSDLTTHTSSTANPHNVTKSQVGLDSVNNTSDANKPVSSAQQAALNLKADITYVDGEISNLTASLDKATPKGLLNCSANPNYPTGKLGDYYYVPVGGAGKIGGASGVEVQEGDKIQCIANSAAGNQATVGANWIIFQGNLDKATTSEAQAGTDDEKYLTSAKGYDGWYSWLNAKIVSELTATNKTIVGAINEVAAQSSQGAAGILNVSNGNGGFQETGITVSNNVISTSEITLQLNSGGLIAFNGNLRPSGATVRVGDVNNAFFETFTNKLVLGDNLQAGSVKEIEAIGSDANIEINLSPKGTGTLKVPTGYELNILSNEDLVNKAYVDSIAGPDANNYVSGTSFATATGILTLNRSGLSNLTVNLDGRYLTVNQNISLGGQLSGSGTTSITASLTASAITGQPALASGLAAADELLISDNGVLKRMDVSVLQAYMQSNLNFAVDTNNYVSGVAFATGTGVLTLSRSGLVDVTVDLDGRYLTGNQNISLGGQLSGSGTTSITATLTAAAVTGQTALTSGLASTDELLISDAGVLKRMDVSVLQTFLQSNLSFAASSHNHSASNITSGTFANSRISQGNVTQHQNAINAGSAARWTTARTLTLAGDVTGSASIDGSANVTITTAYADDGTFLRANADDVKTGGFIRFLDNLNLRFGSGDDFRMWFNGTDMYFRNYAHTNGDIIFQGEDSGGSNENLMILDTSGTAGYVRLYQGGTERMRTVGGGIEVFGNIYAPDQIIHTGDTDTYMQFNAANTWRVVTGGSQRILVNDSEIFASRALRMNSGYNLRRSNHHSGHLEGSYNNVAPNSYKSNPIYTIGSNYNPSDAALGNMYGIGYSHTNASFISTNAGGGWGMYVASDGDARIFLNGSNGSAWFSGSLYIGGTLNGNATSASKWATARTITLAGDVTGSASIDGSSNVTLTTSYLDDGTYLRANASDVKTSGYLRFNDNLDIRLGSDSDFRMWFNGSHTYFRSYNHANGKVFFQDENSSGTLETLAEIGNGLVILHANNVARFRTSPSGIIVVGTGTATDWVATSDARLKENIRPFGRVLNKIMDMRGSLSLFDWKAGDKDDVGYTAQSLRSHFPDFVQGDETLGVSYGKLSAVALEGVAEVNDEVVSLRKEVEELKAQLKKFIS